MTHAHVPESPVAAPDATELRRRSSLPRQALRFVVLNAKILKLSRQHH